MVTTAPDSMSFTERNLTEAKKNMELFSNDYLNGIIDFVKWTSTIAIAAIIWLGSNLITIKGTAKIFTILGIISLLFSLIFSIIVVKRVLDAWALRFVYAKESLIIWRSLLPTAKSESSKQSNVEIIQSIGENIDHEAIKHLVEALDEMQSFSIPNGFNSYIIWHVAFIILGLSLYVFAQV